MQLVNICARKSSTLIIMHNKTNPILLTLVLLLFSFFSQAQVYTSKAHKVVINGSSNVHDWTSVVGIVNVQGDFIFSNGVLQKLNGAQVVILTKSIKSTKNSSIMDDRTYSTLKADKNPNIVFTATRLGGIVPGKNETTVTVSGTLNIAGASRPVDLVFKIKTLSNGDLEIKGSQKVIMSNHGIKPPSFMLGAMKVGDEVTIEYYVLLQKK